MNLNLDYQLKNILIQKQLRRWVYLKTINSDSKFTLLQQLKR